MLLACQIVFEHRTKCAERKFMAIRVFPLPKRVGLGLGELGRGRFVFQAKMHPDFALPL
jgi:hypothetical protein